jgi:lipoprotein-anchoring transpeptidase ErfK/SrfK
MATDYVSILSKAVAGAKNARERQDIYHRARNAVAGLRPGENLTLDQISAQAMALENAIRQIEDGFEVEEELHALAVRRQREQEQDAEAARQDDDTPEHQREVAETLAEPTNWQRVAIIAGVFFLVVGLAAAALWYAAGRNPRGSTDLAGTATPPLTAAEREAIATDLKPGIDGGSSGSELPFPLQRQVVFYRSPIVPGSIVIDREKRYLYLIESDTSARRYGIGISTECMKPGSLSRITNKQEWPEWREASAGQPLPGGPGNPLGARALLFDQPSRLIHGTNSPKTIGHLVALGCIRLVNDDVEDLYRRVSLDTRVIMRN